MYKLVEAEKSLGDSVVIRGEPDIFRKPMSDKSWDLIYC